jgi:TatD DNase family protein
MIDSHCHLADAVFAADLDEVVARAKVAGVTSALCILSANEAEELARVTAVRSAWPTVRFSAGIHPHHAGAFAGRIGEAVQVLEAAIRSVDAAVVGEIGLDYHYDLSPRDVQRGVFVEQVALAVRLGLPVAIHAREATEDTYAVLREAGPAVRGVMHCFSGSVDEARAALDLGLYLSISGIVTFPKGGNVREVAAFAPADRILVETDAPFLAPVPHRGKRNEPAWVMETVGAVANARGVAPDLMAAIVAANFATLIA